MNVKDEKKGRKRISIRICLLLSLVLCVSTLAGCGKNSVKAASGTGVFFDTVVDIRIYSIYADSLLQDCFDLCAEMENKLSAQKVGSELYDLNHRSEQTVEVSQDLADCITLGLQYGDLSDGAFDITVLPLRELWDFEGENPSVPDQEDIDEALAKVDYRNVHCDGRMITFEDPDTQIDLGGIAKGFISAKLNAYLEEQGCASALINLGGNVSVIGTKPDGSEWSVGIQEPFEERGTVFDIVEIHEGCVISSGTYERYFTEDGRQYHHILDPGTGYPAETGLQQASVVGSDDAQCDAFSTICILLGKDRAEQLMRECGWDMHILFIDDSHTGSWYPEETETEQPAANEP